MLVLVNVLFSNGEVAFHLGVHTSNLGADLRQLSNRVNEVSEYINQTMPYLLLFGHMLGTVVVFVQSVLEILKSISESMGTANIALEFGARLCTQVGRRLQ